jgi:hypothetical protein
MKPKIVAFFTVASPIVLVVTSLASLALSTYLGIQEMNAKKEYRKQKLAILAIIKDQSNSEVIDERDSTEDE